MSSLIRRETYRLAKLELERRLITQGIDPKSLHITKINSGMRELAKNNPWLKDQARINIVNGVALPNVKRLTTS